ncbi:MAG: MTAP family purine nucleoside phosphorylase [Spirochaetes bacterium]|nr:MTAP family purine nucleoside phosphorylase [Spirochaetota bacterium]
MNTIPAFAVIGGSNGFRLLGDGATGFTDIGRIRTPFGLSEPVFRKEHTAVPFYYMSRHGVSGYTVTAPFVNYRANVYALKMLSVKSILSWSGPGAIDTSYTVGDFVLPDDIIDETKYRARTFYENTGLGFIRQNPVFCPCLEGFIVKVVKRAGLTLKKGGVYVCTDGPRLETKAEIRKYASYGGSFVGMTLAPEAFLARELEMCYRPLCYITNYAEGVVERRYKSGELFEGMNDAGEKQKFEYAVSKLSDIVTAAAAELDADSGLLSGDCSCRMSMERYRKRGDIDAKWWKHLSPGNKRTLR